MSPAICCPLLLTDCKGEVTVVRLEGAQVALDEEKALSLWQGLLALVLQGRHRLALDLGNVHFLTSTMIEGLLAIHRGLKGVDGRLSVRNPTPVVAEVIDVLGLARVLDVHTTPPSC